MTTKPTTFWMRLRDKIKFKSFRENDSQGLPEVGVDGLLAEPADGTESEPATDKQPATLTRWSKRDQIITQLQEGYERATRVIEEIHQHFVQQSKQTDRICTSLEQLAQSMSDVPTTSRQQVQMLEAIAGQLETTNLRTQQLTEVMGEIPKTARAQTETLNGINRQLEVVGEQNVLSNQKMENLGKSINTMSESSNTQSQAIREMNTRTNEHNELLAQMIAKQSKRFTMLFIVTLILAVSAIATVIIGFML